MAKNYSSETKDEAGQIEEDMSVPLEEIPGPPDGGWGWVVCFCCFLCNMVLDGIAYSFGILLGPLVIHFDSSRSTISWVGSLLCGVYMASGPIVGGLVNKFGCRPVCIGGAVFACVSMVLSTFSPNVGILMLTYGVMGGFGIGCIYLPAVVACGYYFEKKRALATGFAVCGSGVGCFVFAPFANYLLDMYGWKGSNLIFAGLLLNCAVFGALMRPLELVIDEPMKTEAIEEVMVSIEQKAEPPTNDEKGELPNNDQSVELPTKKTLTTRRPSRYTNAYWYDEQTLTEENEEEEAENDGEAKFTNVPDHSRRPRHTSVNTSEPKGASPKGYIKRNASTPGFGRLVRLDSTNEKEVQKVMQGYDRRASSFLVYEVKTGTQQHLQPYQRRSSRPIVRPLSRKDIFYSGSIYNLALDMSEDKAREDKLVSENAMRGYRHSVVTVPKVRNNSLFQHRGSIVASHLSIPSSEIKDPSLLREKIDALNPIWSVFKEMLDFDIMFNPLFALICISNIFGFLAVYIPYVYLPNMTALKGIDGDSSALIISIIGVSNTVGRVAVGAFVDLPFVSSLVVTNISLIMSGVCMFAFPFCSDFTGFVIVALLLGVSLSAFISLTSIVLVDLLGIDSLTSSFGMLVWFRGIASILGPPLAGLVFDRTQDYDASFYMAGAFFISGGILSFIAFFMEKCHRKK